MPSPLICRLWGKARPPKGAPGPDHHPLLYHCLDVAAVADEILERDPLLLNRMAARLGADPTTLKPLVVWLVAQHDLGKAVDGFQALVPDLMERLQGRRPSFTPRHRHDDLGGWLLRERLLLDLFEEGAIELVQRQTSYSSCFLVETLEPLFYASVGHHGAPPSLIDDDLEITRDVGPLGVKLARDITLALADLLLPGGPLIDLDALSPRAVAATTWELAGLTILADWLGSDTRHFPYREPALDLRAYWEEVALPQARVAVPAAGVVPPPPSAIGDVRALFPFLSEPTPLQARAWTLPLGEGPHLYILEDQTGSGKTEAALLLAHRLMAAGRGAGIFVGLPTMATANGIYHRLKTHHRAFFGDGGTLSLRLSHSAARLADLILTPPDAAEAPEDLAYGGGMETATQLCTRWLSDNNKRALLAPIGAGTIDQALLSILPSRHNTLRLLGISRSVLIVDEVHAADAYLGELLKVLLSFHASLGGSAILLSATLPASMRSAYVDAFRVGLGRPGASSAPSPAYPLLTACDQRGVREVPVAPRAGSARQVPVSCVSSPTEIEDAILQAAQEGGCACWIRNTVGDALAAYDRLNARLPGQVHIFHARFMLGDRLAIEAEISRRFGKESRGEARRGQVLIATQVVEQSLDLDFDLMATDLAPIDLILQRAGRMRRHRREEGGDPLEGSAHSDGRPLRPLLVLSPAPEEGAGEDWYQGEAATGHLVYPEHGRLWLTARLLRDRGLLRLPEESRALIEGVYGQDARHEIPPELLSRDQRADERARKDASLANFNALVLEDGYPGQRSHLWQPDTKTPTRLGLPTLTLRLARRRGGELIPLFEAPRGAWPLSDVKVPAYWLAKIPEAGGPEYDRARETMGDRGRWCRLEEVQEISGREAALDQRGYFIGKSIAYGLTGITRSH